MPLLVPQTVVDNSGLPPIVIPPNQPPAERWFNLEMTWRGWDGSEWEITDPDRGVFVVQEGLRGLGKVTTERYTTSSPALAGSMYRGSTALERPVFWPMYLYSDISSRHWLQRWRNWWKTMTTRETGLWTVTAPDGTSRFLRCRFIDDGGLVLERDPVKTGWVGFGVNMIAEQPYWEGEPIPRVWRAPKSSPFFGGPGVINISPGSTVDRAAINNPGDVEAWMVWEFAGGLGGAVVGVGTRTIPVPFAIPEGKKLTIDTRPDQLTAVLRDDTDQNNITEGEDVTDMLGPAADFAPVPPGEAVDLGIELISPIPTTRVSATLTPLYEMGF